MSASIAKARLANDYKHLAGEKWCNIDLGAGENLMEWTIGLMVINRDSFYDGAYLKCKMTFRDDYPMKPPSFKFIRPIYHPNIYPDGRVCISILHEPGEDVTSGESASERWNPLQSPESILRSILVLLDSPEINSPANVDASVLYRDDCKAFEARARSDAQRSRMDIPSDFTMPTTFEDAPPEKVDYDHDFMYESGDDDFGGSDSDVDLSGDDEGDQEFDDSEEDGAEDKTKR